MSDKPKGLYEQISAFNHGEVSNSLPGKLICPLSPRPKVPHKPQIWAGEPLLKQYRRSLGDHGFANMLRSTEITTNSAGAKYIDEFVKTNPDL